MQNAWRACASEWSNPPRQNFSIIIDPPTFAEALRVHMDRHGETAAMLWNAITRRGENLDPATIVSWRKGNKAPRTVASMTYLQRIEERYALTPGYFRAKFPHPCRAIVRERRPVFSRSEHRRLAWHLPDDFERRPRADHKKYCPGFAATSYPARRLSNIPERGDQAAVRCSVSAARKRLQAGTTAQCNSPAA